MKLTYLFFLLLISCSIGSNNSVSNLEIDSLTEEESYLKLKTLEKSLVKPDLTLDLKIADSLYYSSLAFINQFIKSKNLENVLVLAAKCSDGLNLNIENIELINQLLLTFPNSENAPNYLYNKGKIYEEKLKDISKAKAVYVDLISTYPNSELALNMKFYLEFLDKSKTEQLEFLNH